MTGKLIEIKTADIIPSKLNPRTINTKSIAFTDLLDSVKAAGIKVPVMVRPHPDKKGKYELLAGQRRVNAASEANIGNIPALLSEANDEEAFEITFCENFAREDLTPLEEGKAAVIALEQYGGDAAAAASKIGKPISWLMQRAAIEKSLCKEAKEKLEENISFCLWTASHIQQIAGLPDHVQLEVLDEFEYADKHVSVKDIKNCITELMRPIAKAPWSAEELGQIKINSSDKGKKAVRCCQCPKRTSFQPGLFDDTFEAAELKKNDRCLDPQCWDQRFKQYLLHKADELRKEHPKLVFAAEEGINRWSTEAAQLKTQFGQVVFDQNYKVHKKAGKANVPAMIVNGPNAGEIKYIKINSPQTSSNTRPKDEKGKPAKKPLAERKKELKSKRWFAVLRYMVEAISNSTVDDIVQSKGRDTVYEVIKLAVIVGTNDSAVNKINGTNFSSMVMKDYGKKYSSESKEDLISKLFEAIKPNLVSEVTYNGPLSQTPDEYINTAKAIAELLGLNTEDMMKRAEKEYPQPKSWANEK